MDEGKIAAMRTGGKILGETLDALILAVEPGISELEIDSLAEKLIREKGAEGGFKKVPGYKHTICISVNDVVVHGVPTKRVLKENDVVGIDCGVFYGGFHTDMAETIQVSAKGGSASGGKSSIDTFLKVGKSAMFAGIKQARLGNRVGHISRAIQEKIEGASYSVVRSLVGHGVGKELHESPEIPGYAPDKIGDTPELVPGQTLAIEAIYNKGRHEVVYSGNDDWTIVTEDGSISGLFERTVLVTRAGPELLTRLKSDEI